MEKIKVVQNCLKWQENWSKLKKKNESRSKLPEMARKLGNKKIGIFYIPPKKMW